MKENIFKIHNDNIREKFDELLNSRNISDFSSDKSNSAIYNALQDFLLSNVPKKLYRYMAINEHSIAGLVNKKIIGTRIGLLNDPFECIPCFDKQELIRLVKQDSDPTIAANNVKKLIAGGHKDEFVKVFGSNNIDTLEKMLPSNFNIEHFMNELNKSDGITQQAIMFCLSESDDVIMQLFEKVFRHILFQNIACFSENYDSSIMWGLYANKSQGMVLEYDFSKIIALCQNKECSNGKRCGSIGLDYLLFPIIYQEHKYNATEMLFNELRDTMLQNTGMFQLSKNCDHLFFTKLLSQKSNKWSYEKEWRIGSQVHANDTPQDYKMLVDNISPTKILLGPKATAGNKSAIVTIAQSNGIECAEMLLDYSSKEYKLVEKTRA